MKRSQHSGESRHPAARYDVHPSISMVEGWIASLGKRTGRSLEEWLALIQGSGRETTVERVAWLKSEHLLGTNNANWLADRAEGKVADEETPEGYLRAAPGYVDQQYSGKKAVLRPIFEELLRQGKALGGDVKVCPCKTIVPLFRNHVFAQVKAATNTRVDLGLALGDLPVTGRLIDTGGWAKKDRITHRIPIAKVEEIDSEVLKWLKLACEKDLG